MAITKDIYFAIEELRCKYLDEIRSLLRAGDNNNESRSVFVLFRLEKIEGELFEILKEYKKTIPLLIYSQGDEPRPTVVCASCHHVVVLRSHDCPGTPGRNEGESSEAYSARARIFFEKLSTSLPYPPKDECGDECDAWTSL